MESKKRTIMIFPEFRNISFIEEIRRKYDPLYGKVRPHITLVFPFESSYTSHEIKAVLEKRLKDITVFNVAFQGLSASGIWMSLNIVEGMPELHEVHKILYENEFSNFKPTWLSKYVPHITVGQFKTNEELLKAFESEKDFNERFNCLVEKISIETIGENDESIIEAEQPLKRAV